MVVPDYQGGVESGAEDAAPNSSVSTWKVEGRCAFGELLATALLVLLGCMTLLSFEEIRPRSDDDTQMEVVFNPPPLPHAALGFGFVVLSNVMVFGGTSGAHMNPAVTTAALLMGECSPLRAALYVVAQVLGAALGFGALVCVSPATATLKYTCTVPSSVTALQALSVEVVLTFLLGLVCCAAWRPAGGHAPPHDPALPVKFGLTVAGLIYTGGLLSGASLNPARTLAPALWTNCWSGHWVYWVGPLVGAALASLLYRWVLVPAPPAPCTPPPPLDTPLQSLLHKREA